MPRDSPSQTSRDSEVACEMLIKAIEALEIFIKIPDPGSSQKVDQSSFWTLQRAGKWTEIGTWELTPSQPS